jgi:hypothetical protein
MKTIALTSFAAAPGIALNQSGTSTTATPAAKVAAKAPSDSQNNKPPQVADKPKEDK